MNNLSCTAIIVAGGNGKRMKSSVEKQFISLCGSSVLVHTVKNISKSKYVKKIIVVTLKNKISFTENMLKEYGCDKVECVIAGGKTRAESVKCGIEAAGNDCDIILIHDGVRPFIKKEYTDKCIEDADHYGGAVLGVAPKDTITVRDCSGNILKNLNRDVLVNVQTPQCFKRDIIKKAYLNFDPNLTDDASQVINQGGKVHITEGDCRNIKITTPEDLVIANEYIKTDVP